LAHAARREEGCLLSIDPDREVRCRIGGHAIKMGMGELLYPLGVEMCAARIYSESGYRFGVGEMPQYCRVQRCVGAPCFYPAHDLSD